MFKTKNDLSEAIRVKAIALLNARLADAIDLQSQIKQAHWNVKGPNFVALHELFDKINEDVEDYVDDLAERAVQLGGVAEGTARTAAKCSSLSEYPASATDGRSHVEAYRPSWRYSPSRRERQSMMRTISAILTPPTCLRGSRAAPTNGSGSWRPISRPTDSPSDPTDNTLTEIHDPGEEPPMS